MKGLLQYKDIAGGVVKDVDIKNRVVTGYLSEFGSKDHDGDIMAEGCYKRSIDQRRNQIKFLNHHQWAQPHGGFSVLKEDSRGLYFESEPLIDTTYSSDALKLYQAGIIREHSVGFRGVKSQFDPESDANVFKEVCLYEGSNVTLGANPNTPFLGFKSLTLDEVDDMAGRIMKELRNGTLTDEGFLQLEFALKQLQLHSIELGKKQALENNADPLDKSTRKSTDPLADAINNFAANL